MPGKARGTTTYEIYMATLYLDRPVGELGYSAGDLTQALNSKRGYQRL